MNDGGEQLEDLTIKNGLIHCKEKRHTYFHSALDDFISVGLTFVFHENKFRER